MRHLSTPICVYGVEMQQVAVAANGDHRVAAGVEGTVGSVPNAAGTGVATGAANTTGEKPKKTKALFQGESA
jgi:hypothetical protein